jgi:hypothetical protein
MSKFQSVFSLLRILSITAFALFAAAHASAQEIKVEARLIWGSDSETNTNRKIEDPRLNEDLSRIFKWKTYYQITNRIAAIPANETRPLEMSSKCVLNVKNLGDSRIEVSCFGNGKWVSKGAYSLTSGKWLTLGGADRNDTAWFIVMRSRDPKEPAKPATKAPAPPPKTAENTTAVPPPPSATPQK